MINLKFVKNLSNINKYGKIAVLLPLFSMEKLFILFDHIAYPSHMVN